MYFLYQFVIHNDNDNENVNDNDNESERVYASLLSYKNKNIDIQR